MTNEKPIKTWHYVVIFSLFAVLLLGLWKWSFRSNLSFVESAPHAAGPNADKVADDCKLVEYGKKLLEEKRSGK